MKSNTEQSGPQPKTLMEAVKYFSDLDTAHTFFVRVRWPHEICCPSCGSTAVRYLEKYRRFQCSQSHARRQFTAKTGTVMEDSPLGLDKWAVAFWLECNAKNSISSYEVHRALGVTQKSAWFMQHRIRLAMQDGSLSKMGGNGSIVEADETYIGGLARNMHKDRRERTIKGTGGSGKAAVMGLLERHAEKKRSQVRMKVLESVRRDTLHGVIHGHVEPGTHLCTDAHRGYIGLDPTFQHSFIDHAQKYVDGIVHTNGLENFWSLFKRCIKGTHISVEPFHLFRYLDSEGFRFNNREFTDGERFLLGVRGMTGKRLTYKSLIGDMPLEGLAANDKNAASEKLIN